MSPWRSRGRAERNPFAGGAGISAEAGTPHEAHGVVTLDRFRPEDAQPFMVFSPRAADRIYGGMEWLNARLHIDVVGLENIPPGRALIVANHAFGWDVALPMAAVWKRLHRRVWALGEHAWWRFPFLRRLATSVGTIDGVPENADRVLSAGELLLVLPGGLRESVKPRELRYRLLWGHRYGFVRAAIRNRAPIVPLACVGSDDLFDFVGNAYRRGERLLRRSGVPIPLPSRVLPIPHLVPLRYVFGEPIDPRLDPAQADDDHVVRSLRREVEGALHEILERELAHRIGIDAD
jgi:1-acyl-sn-glycerol-3-phosphate acyltransferase